MTLKRLFKMKTAGMALAALTLVATPALARQDTATTTAQPPSAEIILANHATVSPLNLIYVVNEYWNAGNKLQAALWFYVWQIRTAPWAENDPELAQIRTNLNKQFGGAINSWLAADPVLWQQVAERAIAYEPKLPLWSQRPDGLPEEAWAAQVAKTRTEYATDFREAFASMSADEINAARRERGLPVGTPDDQGAPLPEDWR